MCTLEALPNEILIACFAYLNGWDLLHAFDHLNVRFLALLRSVKLNLNFTNVSNLDIDRFCLMITENPLIKQQIHSLHLSDEEKLQQVEIFVSYFSFDEFSSLKSLILRGIDCSQYGAYCIEDILQSLSSSLTCFVLDTCEDFDFDIPNDVCLSNMQRLSIPYFRDDHPMFAKQWITTSLTLSSPTIHQIMVIFQCATELRDFRINFLNVKHSAFIEEELRDLPKCSATQLKRLYIKDSNTSFRLIERLLQCTPNLKFLTLILEKAKEMIDADQWQNLIRTSLIYLTNFQFQFQRFVSGTTSDYLQANFLPQFQRFQDDFWVKEHQWIVRCEYSTSSILVHTIPFPCNHYKLSLSTEHYSSQLNDTASIFNCVTQLSVPYEILERPSSQNFSNIKILRLEEDTRSRSRSNHVLRHKHVESLTSTVCSCNVTDLWIGRNYSLESSSVMIRLLNEIPKISSLSIDLRMFRVLCTDAQVCSSLKNTIKSLFLLSNGYDALFTQHYSFQQFYETFSELEELECDLNEGAEFMTLIRSLSKLSNIAVCFIKYYVSRDFQTSWYRDYSHIVGNDFRCTSELVDPPHLDGDTQRFVIYFKRRAISSASDGN